MNVRTARVEDAPRLAKVTVDTFLLAHRGQMPEPAWRKRREEWTYAVSESGWERTIRQIADGSHLRECVYLAESSGGAIIGVGSGRPSEGDAAVGEVPALYVMRSHQSKGIGRALVRTVAAHLRGFGMPALHIAVLETNERARRFYEALGGLVIGSRAGSEDGPEVVYGWADSRYLDAISSASSDTQPGEASIGLGGST